MLKKLKESFETVYSGKHPIQLPRQCITAELESGWISHETCDEYNINLSIGTKVSINRIEDKDAKQFIINRAKLMIVRELYGDFIPKLDDLTQAIYTNDFNQAKRIIDSICEELNSL